MKSLFVVAALAALALPAFAGERCLWTGYRCENACPLAQKANVHRSFGTEAVVASKVAAADLSAVVVANLARI